MTLIQNLDHIYYISEKAGQILFMTEDRLFTLLQDTATDLGYEIHTLCFILMNFSSLFM